MWWAPSPGDTVDTTMGTQTRCPRVTGRRLPLSTLLSYSGFSTTESRLVCPASLSRLVSGHSRDSSFPPLGWVSPFQDRCQTEGPAFGPCVNHALRQPRLCLNCEGAILMAVARCAQSLTAAATGSLACLLASRLPCVPTGHLDSASEVAHLGALRSLGFEHSEHMAAIKTVHS